MSVQPRPPYSEAELQRLYPSTLRLEQVQVLMRHGERTPVGARFANAGVPTYWPYCSAMSRMRSAILDPATQSFTELDWRRHLETFGADDVPVPATSSSQGLDNLCDMGMLTDRGRETTHALGTRLRDLYVDKLRFLPAHISSTDDLYLRSTPVPRALESMQQAFHGLYPPSHRAPSLPPPTIISRTFADETLLPNEANCRRFVQLARAYAQRAADRWNDSDDMAFLNARLSKYMPEDSPRVAVDAKPRITGIMDSTNATDAHGPLTKLPREFYEPRVRQTVEKIGVDEWFAGYKENNEYRTLGIGGLLGDIVARMVASAEAARAGGSGGGGGSGAGKSPVRFGLSGCHDTTLAAALTSLGAYNTEAWPPFTSHIALELFSKPEQAATAAPSSSASSWLPSFLGGGKSSAGIGRKPTSKLTDDEKETIKGYYVRLRYNDMPVSIPGCKAEGKHLDGDESFCTLVRV